MVNFVNAFLSYGLLLLIFVAVGGLAVFLGIAARKRKNAVTPADTGEAQESAPEN